MEWSKKDTYIQQWIPTCGPRAHKKERSFVSHILWAPPLRCTKWHLSHLSSTNFEMNIVASLSHVVFNRIRIHLQNWLIQVIVTIYFIKIKGYWFFQHGGSTSNVGVSGVMYENKFFTAFPLPPKVLGIYILLLGLCTAESWTNIQVADI